MSLPEFKCDDSVFIATRPGTNPLPGAIVQTNKDRQYVVQPPLELLEEQMSFTF